MTREKRDRLKALVDRAIARRAKPATQLPAQAQAIVQEALDELKRRFAPVLDRLDYPDTHTAFHIGGDTVEDLLCRCADDNSNLFGNAQFGKFEVLGHGCFAVVLDIPDIPELFDEPVVLKVSLVDADYGPVFWQYAQEHANDAAYHGCLPRIFARGRDADTGWRWCISEELYDLPLVSLRDFSDFRARPDVRLVLDDMAKLATVDLHAANIMKRGYGDCDWVANDPVSVTDSTRARWCGL